MKTMMRIFSVLLAAVLLASCGGGGGCAGTVNGTDTCSSTGGGGGTTPTTPAVATLVPTLDKNTINNSGSDKAVLTVTALDVNNNVVSGVAITVALTSGTYTPTTSTTDASGTVSGDIKIGNNKANRTITATISDGSGIVVTTSVLVTGSTISLTPLPASPTPGAAMTVAVSATDFSAVGIGGASISLSGLGYAGTLTTDVAGNATASFNAPATAGSYTLTATGLGVTSTINVVVGTGSTIPNAMGPISAANLSINPNTIAPNTVGSTTNRAQLRAVFRDASNQAIQNVRVRFEIVPPASSVGEQISTGVNTVYSDALGVASADYIAGTTSSATNGVVIRACYGLTDADIAAGACPNSVTATMTVASQPLSVVIGSNNTLQKTALDTVYVQTLVVIVNDSSGVAVSGATISGSVDITHYGKGLTYDAPYYVNNLTTLLLAPPILGQAGINPTDMPVAGKRVWCINEDLNRNGFNDTGEDVNGSGAIEPRKASVSIAFPNGNTTNANGQLQLTVSWPMNVATWLAYTIKISTLVGGTEGVAEQSFITSFVQGDETNGSFLTPLHGSSNCVTNQ